MQPLSRAAEIAAGTLPSHFHADDIGYHSALTGEFADSTLEPRAEMAKFVSLRLLLNLRDASGTSRALLLYSALD